METTWPEEPAPSRNNASAVVGPPAAAMPRPFVFTATGSAYFRIWIVNLLLTIVTIGFYSPWAKVRRLRYFYGNTTFDGSPFEFHGRPFALFKGRVIGVLLLIAYTQTPKVSLALWAVVVLALIALMPWLLWKSLRFRYGNSSYRGIRFAFDGTVGQAYLTFVPLMLAVFGPSMTSIVVRPDMASSQAAVLHYLGFVYLASGVVLLFSPWFYFRLKAYQHGHARLGGSTFAFDGRVGTAYLIFVKAILIGILFLIVAAVAGGLVGGGLWLVSGLFPGAKFVALVGGSGVAYLVLITSFVAVRAMIQNFVWNHSLLGGVRFMSVVGRSRSFRIEIVNVALTLVTLGLFWPFAVVRSLRYRIESLHWSGDSATLTAAPGDPRVGATGEETAELFGLDLAL